MRQVHGGTEPNELTIVANRHGDVAIGGCEALIGDDGGVRVAVTRWVTAGR